MKETNIFTNDCKNCSKEPSNTISIMRFIEKLDDYFARNDIIGASRHINFWEEEARNINDHKGLLTILNEEIGFFRRTNEKEKGIKAVKEAIKIIEENNLSGNVSAANIYVNAATTLKAFDNAKESLIYFSIAEKTYENNGKQNAYEYAALLNNKASAYCDLNMYDDSEKCYNKAVEILKQEGKHDGDIAISFISLAQLVFSKDTSLNAQIEGYLDLAWEYLNSPRQNRDWSYAFILTKCAPSFRFFKREDEAKALEEVAKEIYSKR